MRPTTCKELPRTAAVVQLLPSYSLCSVTGRWLYRLFRSDAHPQSKPPGLAFPAPAFVAQAWPPRSHIAEKTLDTFWISTLCNSDENGLLGAFTSESTENSQHFVMLRRQSKVSENICSPAEVPQPVPSLKSSATFRESVCHTR